MEAAVSSFDLFFYLEIALLTDFAEHRERLALERDWAKKLNALQIESLQKISDAELYAKSKAAEAEQLTANVVELEKAGERVKTLEKAHQEQQVAVKRLHQQISAQEHSSQVSLIEAIIFSCLNFKGLETSYFACCLCEKGVFKFIMRSRHSARHSAILDYYYT